MSAIARTDTSLVVRWWWTVDRLTLAALAAIVAIGAMLTLAASPPVAERLGFDTFYFARRQFVFLGAALAAVAGVLVTFYYGVIDFYIGFLAGIKAFTAAVLGGIGSLPGAMLGGLLIGLIETFWAGYVSLEYKDVAAFSVLIVVLIFFPTGFLGKPDIEKV